MRGAAASVLGPLERILGPREDAVSAARAEQAVLAARLAAAEGAVAATSDLSSLLADPALAAARSSPPGSSRSAPPARRAPNGSPSTPGSRDGIQVDRTVVSADGLVGRVVSVAPWTADVLLVGGPDLVVGVRVGGRGVLGQASGSAVTGAPGRPPGCSPSGSSSAGRPRWGMP